MVTTVMLVDDHQLMREVLVHLLSREPDLEVVATAADAPEALELAWEAQPDVVVMDIDLPGVSGIAATRALMSLDPACRVVMLSASCSERLIRDSADAGACGYLLKGDPPRHLSAGIRAAARGEHPMAPQVRSLCRSMRRADEQDPTTGAPHLDWCPEETS
jgi:DNA-binding NarL/FixJ family response regulator